ncbi:MAG: hypothetical protein B6245_08735 [Desulfobacteraceae bacterium 4572_88]|nr:MAG: hypothetical protein B6245_08735 [Desulfobacteraceae bacterium 4572_88]
MSFLQKQKHSLPEVEFMQVHKNSILLICESKFTAISAIQECFHTRIFALRTEKFDPQNLKKYLAIIIG